MRRVGLRRILEALLVDPDVAGHTAVHPRDLEEVHVVLQVREDHLLHLQRRTDEIHHRQVEEQAPPVRGDLRELPLGSRFLLEELVVGGLGLIALRGDLVDPALDGVEFLLVREQRLLFLLEEPLQILELPLGLRKGRALVGALLLELVLHRVEVRLGEAELLIHAVMDGVLPRQLRLGRCKVGLAGDQIRVRRLEGGLDLIELRGVHRRLGCGDRRAGLLHVEAVELRLEELPVASVVGEEHPQQHQQQRDARQRECPVHPGHLVEVVGMKDGHGIRC